MAYATVPDLILLDMLSAEACRTEVLHALRNNPLTAFRSCYCLSQPSPKNEAKLLKEGATALLRKIKNGVGSE